MTELELQNWINAHGQSVYPDGVFGPKSQAALPKCFVNLCADAVNEGDIAAIAQRLGVTPKQVRAVATVESGGSGFDSQGRPKILFERHVFDRLTNGHHSNCNFSNPKGGGYKEDSWVKLAAAAAVNPEAAFSSASWGKFQVMGSHWSTLGYPSALEMAYSTVTGEAAHYEMLARFIEKNKLVGAMKRLSTNAEDNRAFARAYNGPAYENFHYHTKLAAAMR